MALPLPLTRTWSLLWRICLLASLGCAAEPAPSDLQQFWTRFRAAIERDDREAVAQMTRFPLEVKGMNESDAIDTFTRKEFLDVIYDAMLNQQEYLETDGKMVERPQREWILEKTDIEPRDQMHEGLAFIFSLEISKGANGWQLTRVYLHDPPGHGGEGQ